MSRSLTEVASVRSEITSLDQSLGCIRTRVTGLDGMEKELQRRLTEMREEIEMVRSGFSRSEANVVSPLAHQRQDDMSKQIGMIQNSLTAQVKECMDVQLAVDVHSKRFTSLDERLRVHKQRFQDCPLQLQVLEARLRELKTNHVLHGDRFCSFDEQLTRGVDGFNAPHFSDNLQRFFERISALESRSLDAQSLKLQLDQLRKHVVELQETLAFQKAAHQVDPMPPWTPLAPSTTRANDFLSGVNVQRLRGLECRFETCDARMAEFALKKELTDMGKVMSGVIEEVKVKR